MRRTAGCLADYELLALLADEPDSRVLGSHVDACSPCRARLDELRSQVSEFRAIGPLRSPPSVASTEPYPTAIDEPTPVPTAIGKYLVVGRFEPSGQADVFRVVHPQLQRDLVLKLAKSSTRVSDPSAIIAEGKHLAGLEHPNIIRVHDLDFHEGRPYLVMEYIRARTLAQVAREGNITPRRAAGLVAELSRAVGFAHRRGVVHQDIKPANILIDEAGRPRLIDFGLACQQDAWSSPAAGSEGGTFAYIAPEQARLEPDRVRPLSDLFALGAVLYFLLTGHAPFAAATEIEARDLASRGAFDRSALKAAGVPRRLERICLRAMDGEPAARYATADDLAAELDQWLRPSRWTVPLVAAAALLLAGAVGWRLLPANPDHGKSQPATTNGPTIPREVVPAPRAPAPGEPSTPHGPQYLVHVYRQDQVIDLKDAVPLETGDRLVIRCNLPLGHHASLFWFDTEGKLTELAPVAVSSTDSQDRLRYPTKGVVPLTGPPGTELVLICARRSGPVGRSDVEKLFTGGHPLPQLPRRAVVQWDRDDLRVELSRGVGAPEGNPISDIQDCFEKIHRASRKQFDFVAGVSFRHQERP
jgi:serine/threonine protein kinase